MLIYFLCTLFLCILPQLKSLFVSKYGWSHRLLGALMLIWLLFGSIRMSADQNVGDLQRWAIWCLKYDIVLSSLGILTTLSAARDFPHRLVSNAPGQSGTLAKDAIVTQSEMIEHSFYQLINLFQALFLHFLSWPRGETTITKAHRLIALFIVTSPWLVRKRFPVNSFSSNWKEDKSRMTRHGPTSSTKHLEKNLYKVKKFQYVFYKHFVLHGLNITMATFPPYQLPRRIPFSLEWRSFWLALNASYVLEFFLQTLVKRSVISQRSMLLFQLVLMSIATVSAIKSGALFGGVFPIDNDNPMKSVLVRSTISILSLLLNFFNRGHDVANTLSIAIAIMCVSVW